jgi:hypothetical protein
VAKSTSKTRFGDLGRVFKDDTSDLLNEVARLAVVYEDLRIEIAELRSIQQEYEKASLPIPEYRVIYFLRRALSSIVEFRGGLTKVRSGAEFKRAANNMSKITADHLFEAERYLNQHWGQLKEFRNELGGHVQLGGVKFATENLSGTVGSITWNSDSDGLPMGLECNFAGQIVAGSMTSKLPAGSLLADAQEVLEVIIGSFVYVQLAMCALAITFLWDRFGR